MSDVAVIVIDAVGVARGALKPQTRRHAAVAALMGLGVIVAVNKMDAIGWSQERFHDVKSAFADAAAALGLNDVAYVPISAKRGDNVVRRGGGDWWTGQTLIELLEARAPRAANALAPLRLPIQVVLRDGDARLYAGRIESGSLRPGDKVKVGASAQLATVAQVRVAGQGVALAEAGASVTVELSEQRDLARGDVIADGSVTYARNAIADICWLDDISWIPGRRYRLRQGTLETQAIIEGINFVRDIGDLHRRIEARELRLNDIASVRVAARDPLIADAYADLPGTGAFVLFDAGTNQTVAAGMIREFQS